MRPIKLIGIETFSRKIIKTSINFSFRNSMENLCLKFWACFVDMTETCKLLFKRKRKHVVSSEVVA